MKVVFDDHRVYFDKSIVPAVHRQECLEDKGITCKSTGWWFESHCRLFFSSMVPTVNIYFIV